MTEYICPNTGLPMRLKNRYSSFRLRVWKHKTTEEKLVAEKLELASQMEKWFEGRPELQSPNFIECFLKAI